MINLISANLKRLKLSKIFWIQIVFMIALGIYLPLIHWSNNQTSVSKSSIETLDMGFFAYTIAATIFISVFCCLFLGTEYSDGTMRNKLIVGHSRSTIYLANLIVCSIAAIFFCIAYLVTAISIGTLLIGFFTTDIKFILVLIVCVFVLSIAITSLCCTIAMLIQNKAIIAVVCILTAFMLLLAGTYINARLSEPEYYDSYVYTVNGMTTTEDKQLNSNYLKGTKREVYEFLFDFTPGGQVVQITDMSVKKPETLMLYSFVIVVLTTAVGLVFFKRKDIK